jgi:hypothetical protein
LKKALRTEDGGWKTEERPERSEGGGLRNEETTEGTSGTLYSTPLTSRVGVLSRILVEGKKDSISISVE